MSRFFPLCLFFFWAKDACGADLYLPVDDSGITLTITAGWYYPDGSSHHAIDYGGGVNCTTPILAAAGGVVDVDTATGCPNTYSSGILSFGCNLKITHSDGSATRYSHLCDGSLTVSDGDTVTAGEVIGYMGESGYASGVHLDFRVAPYGCGDWGLTSSCLIDPYNIYSGSTAYPDDGTSVSEVSGNIWNSWPPEPGTICTNNTYSINLVTAESNGSSYDLNGYAEKGTGDSAMLIGAGTLQDNTGSVSTHEFWLAGDIDGNGWDDVVEVTGNSSYTYVYAYTGFGGDGLNARSLWLTTSSSVNQAFLEDMDADGDDDLILGFNITSGTYAGTIKWKYFLSNGSTVFNSTGTTWASSYGKPTDTFLVGDFNGSQKGDLLCGRPADSSTTKNFTSAMTWKRLSNSGSSSTVSTGYGYSGDTWIAADVNNDGNDDLVRIDMYDDYVSMFAEQYSSSTLTFGSATKLANDVGGNSGTYYMYWLDYMDNYSDLLRVNSSGTLYMSRSNAGTSVEEQSTQESMLTGMSTGITYLFGNFGTYTICE